MSEKQAPAPSRYSCGQGLDPNNLPSMYCEYYKPNAGSDWGVVNAVTPSNSYYCTLPPFHFVGTRTWLYPCYQGSRVARDPLQNNEGHVDAVAERCIATYKFQRGVFLLIDAVSNGAIGCPLDLFEYSRKPENRDFSFVVALEGRLPAYWRAVYEFRQGWFYVRDEAPSNPPAPRDLFDYSQTVDQDFYFLVALQFGEIPSLAVKAEH